MSVPIINSVKNLIIDKKDVIIDVPAGTSYPVIESVEWKKFGSMPISFILFQSFIYINSAISKIFIKSLSS